MMCAMEIRTKWKRGDIMQDGITLLEDPRPVADSTKGAYAALGENEAGEQFKIVWGNPAHESGLGTQLYEVERL
jgi:hypothetical protein